MQIQDAMLFSSEGDVYPIIHDMTDNSSEGIQQLYLIMHYTAGQSLDGAVSWFKKSEAKASAHIVIDRDGSVVQMVPFDRRAWHAGVSQWANLEGMNKYSIGIELVNAGKLTRNGMGQWVNWANRVVPDSDVTVSIHKHEQVAAGWHEYTAAQLESAIDVAIALNREFNFIDILGHEDVRPGGKVDPGPMFPMNSFRSKVLGRE